MNGVLLLDKPSGPTSHDAVQLVRRVLRERRCGHTGTLDPFASGLLVLCLGRATRLARFITATRKTYVADVRFGFATDTYDRTGAATGSERSDSPSAERVEQALPAFSGATLQTPPPFSAKKVQGKRSYELARAGKAVEIAPRSVEMTDIELLAFEGSVARIRLTVSSGTYIRSFAHDLGSRLETGAHLAELRRTRVGSLDVDDAVSPDAISEDAVLPPEAALGDLSAVRVGEEAAGRLLHGRPPALSECEGGSPAAGRPLRVLGPSDELLAVAEIDPDRGHLKPLVVWGEAPQSR